MNYRNIGLGVMGFANCLMKLGIQYGSLDAREFTGEIFSQFFRMAVMTSARLASEKGVFPKYKECVFDSDIIKNHFKDFEIAELKKFGLRNCSLLSIAPTGTISTMLGISGGCEPEFALKYDRKTVSLNNGEDKYYTVYCNSVMEYNKANGKTDKDALPYYFVSATEIPWKNRIDMQAEMQEHIDTAISSTINLPKETPIEEVEKLYLYAWGMGIKGITIFRNGCKKEGILTMGIPATEQPTKEKEGIELPRGFIVEVPSDLSYRKYKLATGCGTLYFFLGIDEFDGTIYDCFTNTDGVGGCSINTQANSRLLSLCLRGGIPIAKIIDQLNKSGTCPSFQYQRGKGKVLAPGKSCPSSIAFILKKVWDEMEKNRLEEIEEETAVTADRVIEKEFAGKLVEVTSTKPLCPECNSTLVNEGGCITCKQCGFSKCG